MAWLQRLSKRLNSSKAASLSEASAADQLDTFHTTWLSIQVRNKHKHLTLPCAWLTPVSMFFMAELP